MVERRKPLILSSTRCLLDSVLNSTTQTREGGAEESVVQLLGNSNSTSSSNSLNLRLPAGILRCLNDPKTHNLEPKPKEASFDDSTLVGLSSSILKRLSITSGSLVLVRNVGTKVQRIARVVVLDSPNVVVEKVPSAVAHMPHTMVVFPSYTFPPGHFLPLGEAAYLSPLLAFNLELHISCLKSLVHGGEETLTSLFEGKKNDTNEKKNEASTVDVELSSWSHLPRFASHLRASFVKVPECGSIESFKGTSSIEAEHRQQMIDSVLHDYFKVDRYIARGDVFRIHINWNCKSEMCIPCSQRSLGNSKNNIIYFKVMAMEPLDEPILRVNCDKTALVLGGSVPSAVPPDSLFGDLRGLAPLHGDTVRILASVLTPALCPSALSSKFRIGVLLCGLAGCGKRTVVRYVARCLGLHVVEYSCHDLMVSEKRASVALAHAFNTAHRYAPTILLLRHFEVFRNLSSHDGPSSDQVGATAEVASVIREFTEPVPENEDFYPGEHTNDGFLAMDAVRTSGHRVLLVAVADNSEGLPASIRRCFSHEISMGPLSGEQRVEMLSQSLQNVSVGMADIVKDMVGQTSGFMPRDIRALIADAGANLIPRLIDEFNKVEQRDSDKSSSVKFKFVQDNAPCTDASKNLGKEDIARALERSKKRNASALGTPKVPNVKWEDVGGLEDVKNSILDTVQLPLLHKDLFSSGLRKRSGVLLYGPPGTGKTLLAKAVATECSLNFLSVKGPELINMYIGESEKNIRDIFQKARSARPCVIFFDELDSLAPSRGASGDSGGVMDRVVSQMLAEIDGLNDSTQDLFIIGASNRPDLIDPALLRPGRFDKLLYVGLNSDASYRENILAALTRKFKLHENVDLYSIAKKCLPNFTGADMYALCADAWFHAAKRKVSGLDEKDQTDSVIVEYDDFMKVLGELSPSLSEAELRKYERLRDQFEGAKK
ncbi:AAA+ ATPase domain [Macleaya cordata]|uniref:Peroxisomal ATPase PEX6 n=1 Tax=Macleaya cordata TaxID=56857 RepID=A0A200Q311_MACCD|nr:AAA+ ATPase domain [Macleaya cordata]